MSPAAETVYCALCRRASCSCGSSLGFVRRRASQLRHRDELVEGDGCLLDVVFVRPDGREVEIHIASCGVSHPRLLRCSSRRMFSVAVRRDLAVAS